MISFVFGIIYLVNLLPVVTSLLFSVLTTTEMSHTNVHTSDVLSKHRYLDKIRIVVVSYCAEFGMK